MAAAAKSLNFRPPGCKGNFMWNSTLARVEVRMKMSVSAIALFVLLPTATLAETSAEREACTSDAFRVCWKAIPDRHGVFLCLRDNQPRLSEACRQVMSRH